MMVRFLHTSSLFHPPVFCLGRFYSAQMGADSIEKARYRSKATDPATEATDQLLLSKKSEEEYVEEFAKLMLESGKKFKTIKELRG